MTTTRINLGRDLGLRLRMLLTMAVLGLLYVLLVVVLLVAGVGTAMMLVIVAGLAAAQLFVSDKLALHAIGAREVALAEAPGLHAMIERMCVQADLPKPRIAIAEMPAPNAVRDGSLAAQRGRLRHDRDPRSTRAARARGCDGARALAHQAP